MWKAVQFAAAIVLVSSYAYAQQQAPGPLPPIYPAPSAVPATSNVPPPASLDFQTGFCAGWNAAQGVEQTRYANWRALVTATRTEEGAKTQVGQTADLLVNSVAVYVLVQPAQGELTLSDGRKVVCAAPTAAEGAK